MSTVQAIWYSALLFAIGSIGSAAQLAVFLNRLSSCPDGPLRIRQLLGAKTSDNGAWKVHILQLIVWQIPHSLLNSSMFLFVVGLVVLVCKSLLGEWSYDDKKVFGIFLTSLIYTAAVYYLSSYGIYVIAKETPPTHQGLVTDIGL